MRAEMIKHIGFGALLLTAIASTDADAQRRRRTDTPPPTTEQPPVTNPATGNPVTPPPAGVAPASATNPEIPAPMAPGSDTPRKSLRIDGVVERTLNRERIPIQYDYIREDDRFWEKRLWQVIDTREKMNLPFQYNVEDETGVNQLFINILLEAIKNNEIEAFSPVDDRFSTKLSWQEIQTKTGGEERTVRSIDPVTGEEKLVTTRDEFNPLTVKQFKIKEVWVFDKEASALKVRILGIAPLMSRFNEDGSFRASVPLFWVYYPDLRPVLAKYDVYNQNNDAATMSWEDLFEMRFFSSYVVKEQNNYNREIRHYIKDGVMQLLEGQSIKEKIFNKEQDLWQY